MNFTCIHRGDVICIFHLIKSLSHIIGPVVAKCHCGIISAEIECLMNLNFMTIHHVHVPCLSRISSRV
jgi:hypothetical protein